MVVVTASNSIKYQETDSEKNLGENWTKGAKLARPQSNINHEGKPTRENLPLK